MKCLCCAFKVFYQCCSTGLNAYDSQSTLLCGTIFYSFIYSPLSFLKEKSQCQTAAPHTRMCGSTLFSYVLYFTPFTNEAAVYIIFGGRATAIGSLSSGDVDRQRNDSNPRPSRPKTTTLSAWRAPINQSLVQTPVLTSFDIFPWKS